jgi:anti-sigma factor RsiW
MACEQWKAKLDTYLDSELSEDEMRSFDAHVRSCAGCAADALARVRMKHTLRSAGRRFTPSAEFRARVLSQKQRRKPLFAWGLTTFALVVLVLFSFTYLGQQRARRQVFSELGDLHVSALASPNPVDVLSSDRHTVKPWFEGKIPFSFNLPELQNSEVSLVGGRICYLEQAPGAQLIYRIRKHQISVFIFQEHAVPLRWGVGAQVQQQLSFSQETWSEGGLRFFVVGDVGLGEITQLSQLLKSAQAQ